MTALKCAILLSKIFCGPLAKLDIKVLLLLNVMVRIR